MNFNFSDFYIAIANNKLAHWLNVLPAQITQWQTQQVHGLFPKWTKMLKKIPVGEPSFIDIKNQVRIEQNSLPVGEQKKLENLLKNFHPWRKGPFHIDGIDIDTEWHSDWKWKRLLPHITPLKDRYVLDVGCGNGYHMWRMLGEGAKFVTGIDPSDLFLIQFSAIKKLMGQTQPVYLLPLGIEQLPILAAFDTVFSMGVLYHRRSPIDHLYQLKNQLREGGELVLETLVVDGDEKTVLVPAGRYAKMPNVWFLPSAKALKIWLEKAGFENVSIVDEARTTTEEQRSTPWMHHKSLPDFLDPNDEYKTAEGLPAPKRAILIAQKPKNHK